MIRPIYFQPRYHLTLTQRHKKEFVMYIAFCTNVRSTTLLVLHVLVSTLFIKTCVHVDYIRL